MAYVLNLNFVDGDGRTHLRGTPLSAVTMSDDVRESLLDSGALVDESTFVPDDPIAPPASDLNVTTAEGETV